MTKRIKWSAVRWCGIAAAAVVVAVWPGGGAAGRGTPGVAGAHAGNLPTIEEAVTVAAPNSPAVADATDRVAELRGDLDQLRARLTQLRVDAFRGDPDVLPAAAADGLARSRGAHYADDAAHALSERVAETQRDLDAAVAEQQKAIADYFAALAAAAQEAERAAQEQAARAAQAQAAASSQVIASSASSTGSCSGDVGCFLACTRAHESDTAGGYQAVSPDGVYRGAYQFDQTTWNSVAASVGRGDLVGANPAAVSPADQDTLATALYAMRGNQPWGGRC